MDEAAQRQIAIDMANRVLLKDQSPADSVAEAAEAEQEIIDDARRTDADAEPAPPAAPGAART